MLRAEQTALSIAAGSGDLDRVVAILKAHEKEASTADIKNALLALQDAEAITPLTKKRIQREIVIHAFMHGDAEQAKIVIEPVTLIKIFANHIPTLGTEALPHTLRTLHERGHTQYLELDKIVHNKLHALARVVSHARPQSLHSLKAIITLANDMQLSGVVTNLAVSIIQSNESDAVVASRVGTLLESGLDLHQTNGLIVQHAILNRRVSFIQRLVHKYSVNMNAETLSGDAICHAALSGWPECVSTVLRACLPHDPLNIQAVIRAISLAEGPYKNKIIGALASFVALHGNKDEFTAVSQYIKLILAHIRADIKAGGIMGNITTLCRFPDALTEPMLDELARDKDHMLQYLATIRSTYSVAARIIYMLDPTTGDGKVFHRGSNPSYDKGYLKKAIDILKKMDVALLMRHALHVFYGDRHRLDTIYLILRAITGKKTDHEAQSEIVKQLRSKNQDGLIEEMLRSPILNAWAEHAKQYEDSVTEVMEEFALVTATPPEPIGVPEVDVDDVCFIPAGEMGMPLRAIPHAAPAEPEKSYKKLYSANPVFLFCPRQEAPQDIGLQDRRVEQGALFAPDPPYFCTVPRQGGYGAKNKSAP